MNSTKTKALTGSILFHALLLLLFLLIVFKTPIPPFPETNGGGVEVNFGTSEDGMGDVQPQEITDASEAATSETTNDLQEDVVSTPIPETPLVTQEVEDAPTVEKKKPEEKQKPIESPVKFVALTKKEEPKQTTNTAALFKGKNKAGSNSSGNEGETGKAGDQGSKDGSIDSKYHGKGSGTGDGSGNGNGSGTGDGDGTANEKINRGISFNLTGRKKLAIPTPEYTQQVEGRVVVEITVDQNGNVTHAKPGVKGSTTTNAYLLDKAKQAALNAKFSPKTDGPEEQRGTIVYNFLLN